MRGLDDLQRSGGENEDEPNLLSLCNLQVPDLPNWKPKKNKIRDCIKCRAHCTKKIDVDATAFLWFAGESCTKKTRCRVGEHHSHSDPGQDSKEVVDGEESQVQ